MRARIGDSFAMLFCSSNATILGDRGLSALETLTPSVWQPFSTNAARMAADAVNTRQDNRFRFNRWLPASMPRTGFPSRNERPLALRCGYHKAAGTAFLLIQHAGRERMVTGGRAGPRGTGGGPSKHPPHGQDLAAPVSPHGIAVHLAELPEGVRHRIRGGRDGRGRVAVGAARRLRHDRVDDAELH